MQPAATSCSMTARVYFSYFSLMRTFPARVIRNGRCECSNAREYCASAGKHRSAGLARRGRRSPEGGLPLRTANRRAIRDPSEWRGGDTPAPYKKFAAAGGRGLRGGWRLAVCGLLSARLPTSQLIVDLIGH
jgi:hypothetical protein